MQKITAAIIVAGLAAPGSLLAGVSPEQWLADGKINLDLRYRYEQVEQDNALRDAHAQTLRTRLGLQSAELYGVSLLLEADNVSRVGDARYNSTRNGQTEYSVVADPDGTEINQALLSYRHALAELRLGRQRINLDNQRFIGGVAWRQNEQTFDAVQLLLKPLAGMALSYTYIDQVNSIFGPHGTHGFAAGPANIEGHSHLLNLSYEWTPAVKFTAYQYRLGLDNLLAGTQSSITSGLRLSGQHAGWEYVAEHSWQREHADNPQQLDSRYHLLELGRHIGALQLKAGHEVLGAGDQPGTAFQTPLATKHLFQGWADVYLSTPSDGVRDLWLGGSYPLLGGRLQAWYHDYRADKGGDNYGRELDLAWGRAVPGINGLQALVKYAHYDARDFAVDTNKLWLQLQYSL